MSVRSWLVFIAALGLMGGLIFRHGFSGENADRLSAGSIEKEDTETRASKVRSVEVAHKNSAKVAEGARIPESLSPAQASLLFEDFKSKHPGIRERTAFAQAIIKKLCELGYTREAWDLIEKSDGDVRGNQLIAFFASAKLSDRELLGKISGSARSDIHVSFSGFMSRFSPSQYEEILSSSDFKEFLGGLDHLSAKEARVFKSNISSGLGHVITVSLYETPDDAKDLLKIAAHLNSEGILDTPRFMDIAARFGRSDPFENWGLISVIESGSDNRVGQYRSNMIRDMLEVDAPKALERVLDGENPAKESDIKSAVESWVNLDSRGATDWFQQNRATLSFQDSDAMAAAFSTYAEKLSEFSSARQWAEQIRNPTLKAETIKKIAEAAAAKDDRTQGNR